MINETDKERAEYDSARLAIFDMRERAESALQDIDIILAAIKMNVNERKGPLHRTINNCKQLSKKLQSGEESASMILQTLQFTPEVQAIVDNPTKGLRSYEQHQPK